MSLPIPPVPNTPSTPTMPTMPARPWQRSALYAIIAVFILLGGVWAYARLQSPFPFFGTAYPERPKATVLSGIDHLDQPYTFDPNNMQGKTAALFFGFTHCPSYCPMSLSHLHKVRAAMIPEERERFEIIMVSVDPRRDTPERLNSYVTYFGDGRGLIVPEQKLSDSVREYGVGYQYVDYRDPDTYQVNHTTASYLIDSSGHLRVLWDYSQLPQTKRVLADIRHVMENPE